MITVVVALVAAGGIGAYAFVTSDGTSAPAASGLAALGRPTPSSSSTPSSSTTTLPPTTTTTILPVLQPASVMLPALPYGALRIGSSGDVVRAYEQRLKDLHFDPGAVDGSFDQDTRYAVVTVDKVLGLPRDGVITAAVQQGLQTWRWTPALPKAEGDRVEVDLDRQVLTLYRRWQPTLVTTTSTGSGEHFCGGTDGCQYAITPTGHFHFNSVHRGWDNGKLGKMWNPYYFNGGIAVHGLQSVPTYPASHGCARIPMHIADYFYTLVYRGMSVYVVGTPMKPGSLYVGPTLAPRPPPTAAPPTPPPPPPPAPPTTKKPTPPPPTKPTTPTTKPSPTTKPPPPTT